MACDAEDCGFQMLNDDEIVTSVHEESNPVDDEMDEDEDSNNNDSSKSPSNAEVFSALESAMEWYEQQSKCCPTQLLLLKRIRDLAVKKRRCAMRSRSTGAVFLDIQKAFDRVWVRGLIYKLITNNFPPALNHLINSYLVNRSFKLRVNDTLSSSFNIKCGVPQGSLLGPLLFNMYINDIPTHPQTSTNIYADDATILATYKNPNTITRALNSHLRLLENFFNTWKIKINIDKTIAVLFTRRRKPVTPPTLYSTQLHWSQITKHLGVLLDKNLS
ncbi:RNA-directed DNA polymerase from mobile element jockey [Trichonephila clavipes]|nr:RNA-directed DNA polymerase from mobile element jockey [Trichonephila clavipes]